VSNITQTTRNRCNGRAIARNREFERADATG
jgi:hypothetical protein